MGWDKDLYVWVNYVLAVEEAAQEYQEDGTWHIDMCNCDRCQAIERWIELPWYRKLRCAVAIDIRRIKAWHENQNY